MNYKQIESFHQVILHGSVTKAAKVMKKTQPAVSRLLSNLEKSVGFSLFVRKRNHIVPTAEALMFHKAVTRSFIGFGELQNKARAIANQQIGEIVVAAQPVYIETLLVPILAEFQEKHPDICVKLHDDRHEKMLQRVSDNRCDFGLGITLNLGSHSLHVETLMHCRAVCILPVDHPLASNAIINIQQLNGERFVELSIGSPLRTRIDHLFLKAGIYRQIIAEARTMRTVCNMVENGCGITIADPFVTAYVDNKKVVVRPLLPVINWEIAIITPDKNQLNSVEHAFCNIMRKKVSQVSQRFPAT